MFVIVLGIQLLHQEALELEFEKRRVFKKSVINTVVKITFFVLFAFLLFLTSFLQVSTNNCFSLISKAIANKIS